MSWLGKVLRSRLAREMVIAILTVLANALGRQRHAQ
jgi:hypothetical protein